MTQATPQSIEEMKQLVSERFSEAEQLKLKEMADILRRPMNRKQRRALASHTRRKGW